MTKIFFHDDFLQSYTWDPAASSDRLDHAIKQVEEEFPIITSSPTIDENVLLVHTDSHLQNVKTERAVYDMALLSAGATIEASDEAMSGQPSFALCRPPGHHASPSHSWGFCYFNNVAVAVSRLLENGEIDNAVIVDFDLHFGDGTANIFSDVPEVDFVYLEDTLGDSVEETLKDQLEDIKVKPDIVAVSAGFDRHANCWGGMLETEDYNTIGRVLREFASQKCNNRIFAALEGGYNPRALGDSVLAFCQGLSG
ncbi:histone deacetylase family protein [Natranaerofaba carboxydovora]|uniref:histone deacetylase family protein n=1 Tax=Natranaerofaba carboxydovora TaxID=2742683 RepID=UPI001F12BEDD|nr:histone deacetylase family protein [Natranaerofaba carboxydovora]UMZ74272.1 Histone deacetylase-like amidohydrolase [Natranaerofaba carboxydovora]